MNIPNYQSQGLQPNQAQFLQQQQQQQPQQKGTQLQFNDLFHNINNNNNNNNQSSNGNASNNNIGTPNNASLLLNENNQSTGGLNPSQLLAQTLYQGQYRAQTPQQQQQQRSLNIPQQQQQVSQQPTSQLLQAGLSTHHSQAIELDPTSQSSSYWQDQIQLVEASRKSNLPHFYARHAAMQSRRTKQQFIEANHNKTQSLVELTKQLLGEQISNSNESNNSNSNNGLLQNRKVSHALNNNDDDVNNDDEYDDELGEQRVKFKSNSQQLWGSLDLSGQDIPNLSLNLFKYDFLTKLYLNGNKLSTVPNAIKNLKNLKILDLSNNDLSSVPFELGLLYNLKYLYLFDNNIQTLPYEFGNLFELHFLGIEGNPNFNSNFAKLLAQKGTRSLIIHLRDNSPKSLPPPKRQWISLKEDGELDEEDDDGENKDEDKVKDEKRASFTALTFNLLCHHYATAKLFSFTPSWALNWEYRRELIKNQIFEMNSDVLCLQEVETQSFEDFWLPLLAERGYRGLFHAKYRARRMNERDAKKVDGCAIFYKHEKFSLAEKKSLEYTQIVLNSHKYKKSDDVFNRLQSRDNIGLVTILKHLETGENILVANTHLHWDPALNDVKAVQVGVLLEEIETIVKKACKESNISNIKDFPMFICGDFNSQLHSAVYKLLANGFVKDHEDVEGRDYGKFTEVGFQHPFNLRSAYDSIGELPFTNFTPSFTDVLDYIWYTPNTLSVRGLLGEIDKEYTSHYIGLPNAHLPSDHIPLMAEFHLRDNGHGISKKDGRRDNNFKPEFRSSRKT